MDCYLVTINIVSEAIIKVVGQTHWNRYYLSVLSYLLSVVRLVVF